MGFNCINNDHIKKFNITVLDESYNIVLDKPLFKTQLNGCTCDSIDILNTEFLLPEMKLDYKLVFHNFGAYTYSAGASFNGMELPEKIYIDNDNII